MRIFSLILMMLFITLTSQVSYAEFSLVALDPPVTSITEELSTEETQEKVQQFLNGISMRIPSQIKEKINEKIRIGYKESDENGEIPQPECSSDSHEEILPQENQKRWVSGGRGKIKIHPSLISLIVQGEEKAFRYSCGHQNGYRLLQAEILKVLLTQATPRVVRGVYDICVDEAQAVLDKLWHFRSNPDAEVVYKNPLEDPLFYKLAGWQRFGKNLLWEQRNCDGKRSISKRSPTPWPVEDYVNRLVYFLLEPENQCRAPLLYDYFKKFYHFEPSFSKESSCSLNTKVILQSPQTGGFRSERWVNLDPKRVYQVHYLVASPGSGTGSQLGHSMFRLILCPRGEALGPGCLQNTIESVVVSYSAILEREGKPGIAEGVKGEFPAQFFLYPFLEVVDQYTRGEYRTLESRPMLFNRNEVENFVLSVISNYWEGESSRYRLLNGNCVIRSIDLIKTTSSKNCKAIFAAPTPYQLRDVLVKKKLVESFPKSLFKEEMIKNGWLFPSEAGALETRYENLQKRYWATPEDLSKNLFYWKDFHEYVQKSTSDERRQLFEVLHPEQDRPTAARLRSFEQKILARLQSDLGTKSTLFFREKYGEFGSELLNAFIKAQQEESLQRTSPFVRLKKGYGIPLPSDFEWEENFPSAHELLLKQGYSENQIDLLNQAKKFQEENFLDLIREIQKTSENIDRLGKDMN